MNDTMNDTNNTATAEAILLQLAQNLAEKIGEPYATVKLDAYADGNICWTCYTSKTRHTSASTFADALAAQFDHAKNAAKLRAEAAELLAKAAALEAMEAAQ